MNWLFIYAIGSLICAFYYLYKASKYPDEYPIALVFAISLFGAPAAVAMYYMYFKEELDEREAAESQAEGS